MKLKMKILMLMCVVFSSVRGQQKDSLSYKSMYTINENLQFEYSKTTFFEMFKNIPDNVYQFGKYTIQSENLLQVGSAVGSTLVLLPLDQKIIENSTELGEKIGWVGDGVLCESFWSEALSEGYQYSGLLCWQWRLFTIDRRWLVCFRKNKQRLQGCEHCQSNRRVPIIRGGFDPNHQTYFGERNPKHSGDQWG